MRTEVKLRETLKGKVTVKEKSLTPDQRRGCVGPGRDSMAAVGGTERMTGWLGAMSDYGVKSRQTLQYCNTKVRFNTLREPDGLIYKHDTSKRPPGEQLVENKTFVRKQK